MKLLICNWKQNKNLKDAMIYKKKLEECASKNVRLVICPSFPLIPVMHSKKYEVGAQDVSEFKNGSYTGEVSAECLKSLDVKYVIIGHHEREMYFLENHQKQLEKIKNALEQNLKVVIPLGETLMEYQLGKTFEVIEEKLRNLLIPIPQKYRSNIIIAYEPIWKVGKNLPLNKKEVFETIIGIKKWLYNNNYPNNPVLYGGGLTVEEIKKLEELDGFLLGNLSLDVEKMCKVLENYQESTNIYKT